MAEQRLNEWFELSDLAKGILLEPDRHLSDAHLSSHNYVLRMWHFPSFKDNVSWSVYRPAPRLDSTVHVLQELTWYRSADSDRMMDPLVGSVHPLRFKPIPKVSSRTVEISENAIQALFEALLNLQINPFAMQGPFGLDGESFGVDVSLNFTRSTFTWWCEGPGAWSGLVAWTHETIAMFDGLLKDSEVVQVSLDRGAER